MEFFEPRSLLRKRGIFVRDKSGYLQVHLFFFVITLISFEWIGIKSADQALVVGGLWFICMLILEFAVGHFYFHFPWTWLLNDFNFFKGRLLIFGMLFLALSPYLVGRIRHLW